MKLQLYLEMNWSETEALPKHGIVAQSGGQINLPE
jgi:hypothetical protein